MSRLILSNADHLDTATASVTATPLSMCAWVKIITLGAARQFFNLGTSASGDNRWALSTNATNFVVGTARDTAAVSATTTLDIQNSAWHMASCTFASATSRSAYLDGGNIGTGAANKTPGTPNVMRIGSVPDGTNPMIGWIAHVALWNIALSDEEHRLLTCYTPNLIEAANLIEYWPLLTDGTSLPSSGTSATAMTATGTQFSQDNPTFAPSWYYYA